MEVKQLHALVQQTNMKHGLIHADVLVLWPLRSTASIHTEYPAPTLSSIGQRRNPDGRRHEMYDIVAVVCYY